MKSLSILSLLLLLCACSRPEVPATSVPTDRQPMLRPDYTDVTVPCNIAPLNFSVAEAGTKQVVARFTTPDGSSYLYGSRHNVVFDDDEWQEMLAKTRGNKMQVEV